MNIKLWSRLTLLQEIGLQNWNSKMTFAKEIISNQKRELIQNVRILGQIIKGSKAMSPLDIATPFAHRENNQYDAVALFVLIFSLIININDNNNT